MMKNERQLKDELGSELWVNFKYFSCSAFENV